MRRWMTLLATAALMQVLAPALAQTPQPYQPPRTVEGHPDLQGVWATAFLTGLERPDDIKALVLPPDEARTLAARFLSYTPEVVDPDANFGTDFQLAIVKGGFRSSLVVEPTNGRVPFSDKALAIGARSSVREEYAFDNPEERPTVERCLIGWAQAPLRPQHGFVPTQIVQTTDVIVLMTEDVGGLRIVQMNRPPPPAAVRSLEGYSTGRWEGDTLVIETTHLRADDPFRDHVGRTVVVGPNSRIIERLTRLSDTELLHQYTVEDPEFYTQPWLAEYSQTRSDQKTYEYACHEANYAMTNALLAGRLGRQPTAPAQPGK